MKFNLLIAALVMAAMAIAGPAETTAENLCGKHAPTERACLKL